MKHKMMTVSLAALAMSAPSALVGGVRNDDPAPKPKTTEALMTELHGAFNEYKTANDTRMKASVVGSLVLVKSTV